MRPSKSVLTTGEVAKLCNVAPRTVSKWFDAGHLRGYRIPGSKDRRIPIDQLIHFMRAYGIPLNGLDNGWTRVLVLDSDMALCNAIKQTLQDTGDFDVAIAQSAIEAGAAAQELKPNVIIADVTLPDVTPIVFTRFVRSLPTSGETLLIGIAQNLSDADGQALLQEGFDGYLSKPFDTVTLVRMIKERVAQPVSAVQS